MASYLVRLDVDRGATWIDMILTDLIVATSV
jgi:hypothetical protein